MSSILVMQHASNHVLDTIFAVDPGDNGRKLYP